MIKANFLISVIMGLSAVNVASAQMEETPDELILNKKLPIAPFDISAVFTLLSFALGILTLVLSICSQTCPLVMKNLVFL